jgi:hypothetical protein
MTLKPSQKQWAQDHFGGPASRVGPPLTSIKARKIVPTMYQVDMTFGHPKPSVHNRIMRPFMWAGNLIYRGFKHENIGKTLALFGLLAAALWILFMSGCAIAQSPDGSFVVGTRWSGDGASASGIGNAVGSIASIWLGPAGAAIGTLVTGVLTLAGYGIKKAGDAKAAEAAKTAADAAYDEGQSRAYAHMAQPPVAPAVAVSGGGAALGVVSSVADGATASESVTDPTTPMARIGWTGKSADIRVTKGAPTVDGNDPS